MVWRATASATPAPASNPVIRWPRSGTNGTTSAPSAANSLRNGDVGADADVGRERRHDRAILLERQVDRTAGLRLVGALAADREVKRDRRVASRFGFAAGAEHRDLQRRELDALLLKNDHDIRRGARRRRQQQELHR